MQDTVTRELIVHTSQTKRSTDFVALLELIDPASPQLARAPVVLVLDNVRSTPAATSKALAARPCSRRVLPKYAPELNDIELACAI